MAFILILCGSTALTIGAYRSFVLAREARERDEAIIGGAERDRDRGGCFRGHAFRDVREHV